MIDTIINFSMNPMLPYWTLAIAGAIVVVESFRTSPTAMWGDLFDEWDD